MKILLTAVAIIVGCASPFNLAQSAPATEIVDKSPVREVVTKDEAVVPVESAEEQAVAPRPVEPDPLPFVRVDGEQASLNERIAATKFSAAKHDSLSPIVSELRKNDPFPAKQGGLTSGWHFAFAPYLFAAGISGTVGARGRVLELDANFSGSVWDSLDFGLMGAFEARKGRFVSFNDFMWIKLSQERDTPGPLYDTAKLGVNFFMFNPEVGYRLIESERGSSLDVLGGVRIWSVETNLNVTTGVLEGFDVSQRKTWGAPVVGLHGVYNATSRFFLAGKFDIGGAGIGADLTTQLYGAAGFRVHRNVALVGGYRWLQVDYDDEEGFLFDTQMQGLMFGAKFSW